ncbi:endo alpha-1,4 polygalactosaminidase [Luteococcus sp. Sow4_B9]|uniref:endo alpha-1,4 polygalactosaminidase n=1 Tax=Luteococcus sp. Sow4_B9 TaxID=3438792 RepID=UPI003F9B24DB
MRTRALGPLLACAVALAGCMGSGQPDAAAVASRGTSDGPTRSAPGKRTTPSPLVRRPSPAGQPSVWRPVQGQPFHIQLTGRPVVPEGVSVVILDWEETPTTTVAALRARGVTPICYLNAGGHEDFRPDRGRFPSAVVGRPLDGWPGERWLDIRQRDRLLPIMASRMDVCRQKGFTGVDPDNLDGHETTSGFPLTSGDAVAYQKGLAELAHQRGLAIGLKNALDLLPRVSGVVDFAVNEECLAHDECGTYRDFLASGKAVFHIEYAGSLRELCSSRPAGFSTVLAPPELDGPTRRC